MLYGALLAGSFMLAVDQGKNVMKLGFSTTTPFESEYKVKPDYMTKTVFAAQRKDLKQYREL